MIPVQFKVRQPIRPTKEKPKFNFWCWLRGHDDERDLFMYCGQMASKGYYLHQCNRCGRQKKETL